MANTKDPFEFQEFEEAESLLEETRDATTINIDDVNEFRKQRRPGRDEVEEDLLANDDKAELLSGQKKNAPFWSFDYYQKFFDVDTYQVRSRIIGSVLPWRGKNFIELYVRRNPDLYGPFWICATLVFAIAICGNLSKFLVNLGSPNYKYTAEFGKVTIAATAIYSYAWLVPLALWGFLLWRNSKVMNLVTYSFMEIVCAYGYSLSIYIPAVVLWIIPSEGLRWFSVVLALCLSGSVLLLTFWPAIKDDHIRVSIAFMSAIVVLNVLLAVGFKAYFFSSESPHQQTNNSSVVTLVQSKPHT
ncbi:unnamed protein product [Boreogadus saida]|uniref:protein YIPF1 n=1 Tax=Gadus chalcogrammus TaxID=1042646 RepID=UPI0024C4C013|nr:protein YIPF1 [Gadus chalcogrammus]XP_059914588.1 protein YIPF1 [Gadus macrocephalus]XP_059914589.1 protein YIPF1 [Gadus macrocephalus]